MQVWKRRVVALVAAGVGGAGLLMSTAGAQTGPPTSVPSFTIPEFPDFPDFTIPDFTIPTIPTTIPTPPTMPPSSTTTTGPPPTMPPSTTTTTGPPPTMPPTTSVTLPDEARDLIEDAISRLEEFGDLGAEIIEDLRALLDLF